MALGRRRAFVPSETGAGPPELRLVRRRRGALNPRALIGGLLVTLAGLTLFVAYSGARADHRLAFVVAAHDLQPGERLALSDLTTARMQLPSGLADNDAFRSSTVLDGAVMVAPLRAGELVQASDVVAAANAPSPAEVSFSIDSARAVAGTLQAGETVTVLATYGTGPQSMTVVVVPSARVVSVSRGASSIGAQLQEEVTLGLDDPAQALSLTNAVDAAQLELVRTDSGIATSTPYRVPAGGPTS